MSGDDRLEAALRALAEAPALEVPDRLAPPSPGERIGRFELLREIGRGGFGVVYEARDGELGRRVALKLLRALPFGPARAAAVERLRREAAAAARLAHRGIVTLHDFGVDRGTPYLVMELLDGEPLDERLRRGPLALPEALDLALQIARALQHAHTLGVIHRDLKPGNVFLCRSGDARLLDFGLAWAHGAPDEGRGGGTPAFAAPEQRRGEEASAAADVYGAGALLWAMLSGKAPPLPEAPGLPAEVERLLRRALAAGPGDRPPGAEALLDELLAVRRALDGGLVLPENPYRWLEPFAPEHAGCFFGRERETARLAAALEERALVAVVGPSGAGKSSLLRAGLLPALRRRGRWEVVLLRPGRRPLAALAAALRASCAPGEARGLDEAALRERPAACAEALRALCRRTGGRALLVVDHLEELAAQPPPPEERGAFEAALLAVADEAGGPLRVALALREEFLSRVAGRRELREAIAAGLLLLSPPDRQGLLEAARGPAAAAGYELEPGLAEQVVGAVEREVAPLPLLELAMSRLWEERDRARRLVPGAALQRLGGLHRVLGAHASAVLRALAPAEQVEARRILLRLVTPEDTRRPAPPAELGRDGPSRAALARLLDGRLLVSYTAAEGELVELAHETLITGWDELRALSSGAREHLQRRAAVAQAAALWEESGAAEDLLWKGERLRRALELRSEAPGLLEGAELRFVEAGERVARRARRRWRLLGAAAALAAAAGVAALGWVAHSSRLAARAARVHAIVAGAPAMDPALAALLLAELAGEPEPPGGLDAVYAVAASPLPLAILRGHTGPVTALAFGPGGTLASGSTDRTIRLGGADGRGPSTALALDAAVSALAFGPDGRLAAGTAGGVVRISGPGGAPGVEVARQDGEIGALAFDPSGRRLLVSGRNKRALLARSDGSGVEAAFEGHDRVICEAGFDAAGRVVTASADGTARLWQADGRELRRFPLPAPGIHCATPLALDRARGMAVLAARSGALLQPLDGGPARALALPVESPARLRLDPTGARLLAVAAGGRAFLVPLGGAGPPEELRQASVVDGAFSPDGRLLLAWGTDGRACLFALAPDAPPRCLRGPEGSSVGAFSADGRRFALGGSDGGVRVFASDAPALVEPVTGPMTSGALALSPDGRRLLAGSWLLSLDGDRARRAIPRLLVHGRFSPDGARLLTVDQDGRAELWPAAGGPPELLAEAGIVRGFFSRRGERIALQHRRGELLLLDSAAPAAPRLLELEAPPKARALSPDFDRLAGFGFNHGRISGGPALAPPPGLDGRVIESAFSDDGLLLALATGDGVARVIDAGSGSVLQLLRGHRQPVLAIAFLPDGRLATTSDDGTARIWGSGGQQQLLLGGSPGPLPALAVAAREPVLATGDDAGRIRVFRLLDWRGALAWLRASTTACLSTAERAADLGEPPAQASAAALACEAGFGRVVPGAAER